MSGIAFMRLEFGPCSNVCANCYHLKADHFRPHVKKCEVYSMKSYLATDWSGTWPACGAFNKDVKMRDVFERLRDELKHKRKQKDQLDGQISFSMEVKE